MFGGEAVLRGLRRTQGSFPEIDLAVSRPASRHTNTGSVTSGTRLTLSSRP
jgi:hypothetical protein